MCGQLWEVLTRRHWSCEDQLSFQCGHSHCDIEKCRIPTLAPPTMRRTGLDGSVQYILSIVDSTVPVPRMATFVAMTFFSSL
jgi:hypothetical protein